MILLCLNLLFYSSELKQWARIRVWSELPVSLMKDLVVLFLTSMCLDKVAFVLLERIVNSLYSRLLFLLLRFFHLSGFFDQTLLFLDLLLNSKHFCCSLCNRCLCFFISLNHALYISLLSSSWTNSPLGALARSRGLSCRTISFREDMCGIYSLMRVLSWYHFLLMIYFNNY